jgi:uncharacterized membrane protein
MQKPNLPDEEVGYCRKLTGVWALALVLAAALGLLLGAKASPELWAAWSGVGCYLYVGIFFGAELLYRQFRFRQPNGSWLARALYDRFPRTLPKSAPTR